MKKMMIFGVLMFAISVVFGQVDKIGLSFDQIQSEYKTEITGSGINENGQMFLVSESKDMSVTYVFDENAVCVICYVFPANEKVYMEIVNGYNSGYNAVTNMKWKSKSNGSEVTIEQKTNANSKVYFEIY